MKRPTVADLAQSVNDYCARNEYFWAYALLKDTLTLWTAPDHEALLDEHGQYVLWGVRQDHPTLPALA